MLRKSPFCRRMLSRSSFCISFSESPPSNNFMPVDAIPWHPDSFLRFIVSFRRNLSAAAKLSKTLQ
jgi:hypothetical protein